MTSGRDRERPNTGKQHSDPTESQDIIALLAAWSHKMAKRSGRWARVTHTDEGCQGTQREVDVLDLNNALDELSTFDQRKARVA